MHSTALQQSRTAHGTSLHLGSAACLLVPALIQHLLLRLTLYLRVTDMAPAAAKGPRSLPTEG